MDEWLELMAEQLLIELNYRRSLRGSKTPLGMSKDSVKELVYYMVVDAPQKMRYIPLICRKDEQ